jgi:hypothetical protein
MTIDVKFNDSGRKAQHPADPRFPRGVDASCAQAGQKSCTYNLPYPAPQVGTYSVVCRTCKFTALITVAGRTDDPRTVTLPCKTVLS